MSGHPGRACLSPTESEPRDIASRILGADPVRASRAVRPAVAVAARLRAGQADRPEVGHAVPDLDPAGRPGPSRGVLAGRANAWPATAAPVPADFGRGSLRWGEVMSGLEPTMATARRGAAWLLPADRFGLIATVLL